MKDCGGCCVATVPAFQKWCPLPPALPTKFGDRHLLRYQLLNFYPELGTSGLQVRTYTSKLGTFGLKVHTAILEVCTFEPLSLDGGMPPKDSKMAKCATGC
jgi:hypothetical protein